MIRALRYLPEGQLSSVGYPQDRGDRVAEYVRIVTRPVQCPGSCNRQVLAFRRTHLAIQSTEYP